MAAFNYYNQATEVIVEGINSQTDAWKIILSNTAQVATNTTALSCTELSTGGGYTSGGNAASLSSSAQSAGVYKLVLNSPADWTGSGAGFTARYAILWNSTLDAVVGWWDYGSSQLVNSGEIFRVTLDNVNGVFQVTHP